MTVAVTEFDDTTRLRHLRSTAEVAGVDIDEFVLPEDQDVVIDGLRIHYLDWGNPGLPAVIFLHGGGLTAHTWDLPCLALRQRFHCIAPDLRGHGDSEWSPELAYRIADLSGDVTSLADRLGVTRFALVGMSLGGMVAMSLAGEIPERLTSLTVIDAGTRIRMDSARRIRRFMTEVTAFDSIDDVIEWAIAFNPRRDPDLLRNSLRHNLRRLPDGRWAWKYDNRHRREDRYLTDLRADAAGLSQGFRRVECPVLVIRGEQSDVFRRDDAIRLAGSFERGRMVEIPAAGHTVQGDNPADLIDALAGFLGAED